MEMWKQFFSEFKSIKENVKPCGIAKLHFIKSEWDDWTNVKSPSWPFIAWRVAYLIFCIFAVLRSMIDPNPGFNYWFLFVTHWTIFCELIYCLLYIINISIFYVRCRNGKSAVNDLSWIDSCIWILFNIVGVAPYVVTLGYWAAIYNPKNPRHIPHKTMFNHGINAIFTLIDTLLVAIPVHVTHVVYLVGFCGIYAIFTLLYEICGGPYPFENIGNNYIYSFLNWREKPGRTVGVVALVAVIVPIVYYVLWLLYFLRLFVVSKCTKLGSNVYERHKEKVDEAHNGQGSCELGNIEQRM